MFIKDILNDFSKDQLKEIRDYFCENGVYIQKEAKKLIADGLLGVIYKPTPLKWPTNDSINDSTNGPIDGPTNGPTNSPTNNLILALLLLLTAFV